MYLVSSCLAGVDCKYSGGNNLSEKVLEIVKEGKAILVCPEQMGGLETPRLPSEIVVKNGERRVLTKDGEDVSLQFKKGAGETLKIAKMMNIKKAILKSRSPSCGCGRIYDGSFSSTLIDGDGITVELLKQNGIKVINEDSLKKL